MNPNVFRLYNLYPLLAGKISAWVGHLDRIKAMNFDWVFVNSFHYPGFSGSLYAVKDFERLHPLFDDGKGDADRQLRRFTSAAKQRGLKVMMDLTINHVAKDAHLVEAHPGWFKRDHDGELISPRAVHPDDPRRFTIWGDLAKIDYDDEAKHQEQIAFWRDHIRRFSDLGFSGYRCDVAYQVPTDIWQPLISSVKETSPDCVFLGRDARLHPDQVIGMDGAGFDLLMNSAKWWDFRSPWLLEQYERYRLIAPTVAFPESHDTARLAIDLGDPEPDELERHYRFTISWRPALRAA